MEVYKVEHDDIMRFKESDFGKEEHLEERLVRTATARIGGVNLLYLGRQGTTKSKNRFDLTALDKNGDLVVVELKKGQAPRRVIAQALDYVSDLQNDEYRELEDYYEEFLNTEHYHTGGESQSLRKAHSDYFDYDEPLPEDHFNDDQRIIIIGESFNEATHNMADYLRERGEIDVILVQYQVYLDDDRDEELLITNALLPPLEDVSVSKSDESRSAKKKRRKDFWDQFQRKHQEEGLHGGTSNAYSASYGIHVFRSGNRKRPAFIRPTVRYSDTLNLIRFYEGAREIPTDKDHREVFESAVEGAVLNLDVKLPTDFLDQYELEWDVDKERDFDKVRINYGDVDHDEFRDEETIKDIQRWLVDTSRVFKTALEELAEEGYINNTG